MNAEPLKPELEIPRTPVMVGLFYCIVNGERSHTFGDMVDMKEGSGWKPFVLAVLVFQSLQRTGVSFAMLIGLSQFLLWPVSSHIQMDLLASAW